MLPGRKRPGEGRRSAFEGLTHSFASSSSSRKRPDTASTVNSFASARGFSSDDAYSPPSVTSNLPRPSLGAQSIETAKSRSSTSSSSGNHHAATTGRHSLSSSRSSGNINNNNYNGNSKKTSFEEMLRSGNTWVMSETAEIAKDEAARRRLAAPASSSASPMSDRTRRSFSSSRSSPAKGNDAGRRLIVRRASELLQSEDADDDDDDDSSNRYDDEDHFDDRSNGYVNYDVDNNNNNDDDDDDDGDTTEGHSVPAINQIGARGVAPPPRPRRRAVKVSTVAETTQETINEEEATPRMGPSASPLHAQDSSSARVGAPHAQSPHPFLPRKSMERSPSTSTRNSSLARYTTPPSGGASPVLAPIASLPVHPHHREIDQQDQQSASIMATSSAKTRPRQTLAIVPTRHSSSSSNPSPDAISGGSGSGGTNTNSGLGLDVGSLQTITPSPSSMSGLVQDSISMPPRAKSKPDTVETKKAAAYMPFPSDNRRHLESISLEAEQRLKAAELDKLGGTTFLKERIKKTSGFLRRLRGGGGSATTSQTSSDGASLNAKLGDIGRSQTARATMSAAKLGPLSTPKLNRKGSQNSVASEGGASIWSAPGGSSRAGDFTAEDIPVPVPSIPSKFKDQLSSTPSSHSDFIDSKRETRESANSSVRRAKSKQRNEDVQEATFRPTDGIRSTSSPLSDGHTDGTRSAPSQTPATNSLGPLPASSTRESVATTSTSSSNTASHANVDAASNAATGARGPSEGYKRHIRKASSTHGGSTGSGSTEMRHALNAWASEMEQTLSTAAQDLDVKTKMQKPGIGGPTPQLPEIRPRNRSRSFMEDEDEVNAVDRMSHSAPNTPHFDLSNSAFSTPQGTLRSNANAMQRPSAFGLFPSAADSKGDRSKLPAFKSKSDPVEPTTVSGFRDAKTSPSASNNSNSLESPTDISSRYDRSSARSENASNMTSVSYETAIDRPSAFLQHTHRREEPSAIGDLDVSTSSEDIDPESSIRLITPASTDGSEHYVTLTPSKGGELTSPLDTIGEGKSTVAARKSSDQGRAEWSMADGGDMNGRAKEMASHCWNEDESFKKREKIAEWLGSVGTLNHLARQQYFQHFDFAGLRLDTAFRHLCDKLFLRAETQQVDRILSAFSTRYFECNPTSLYGSADVVHSVVFSLLLLNTDLHVADIADRMTRTQFVRNTLSALAESGYLPSYRQNESQNSFPDTAETGPGAPPLMSPSESSSTVTKTVTASSTEASNKLHVGSGNAASGIMRSPSLSVRPAPPTRARSFEGELENTLKDMYAAVKADRIRLPLDESIEPTAPMHNQRRPSKLSAPGSERYNALKRGSIRGIQGLLGNSASALRSDDSLSPSSFGGKSLGDSWLFAPSTSTVTSHNTAISQQAMPTLGFANTLSQSIIREANDEDGTRSVASGADDVTDDELALLGPPWAKEGTLTRKHYWDAPQKRSKDKNWIEVFAVAQKGTLSAFRFGDSTTSSTATSQPHKGAAGGIGGGAAMASGVGVGGGNWLSNAVPLGHIPLAHSLANALPPPGYNRARPHVFALTLTSGDVYFFQTGHEELVQEWVSTCNYWAARQSREPFAGGVSNMEYGWNRVLPQLDIEEEGRMDDADEADEVLANVNEEGPSSPSMQADVALYMSSNFNNTPNLKGSDSRSVRSGKSGRSLRSRAGSNLFQTWNEAASTRSGGTSILEGQGGYGGGGSSSAATTPSAGRSSGGALKRVMSNATASSAPGSVPGSPARKGGNGLSPAGDHRSLFVNEWRPPAAPMQPSTLSEDDQLEACLRHTKRIETELTQHNALREPMLALRPPPKALANWERKSAYLLGELTKFQVYVDSLQTAARLRAEMRGKREVEKMIQDADDELAKVNEAEEGPPMRTSRAVTPS